MSAANAEIVRIVVDSTEDVAAHDGVPAYRTISGQAHGELDPAAVHNRIIQDLPLAPRNRSGRVEYSTDFTLTYPVDVAVTDAPGAGVLLYDAVNRGAPLADLGLSLWRPDGTMDSFLMRQQLVVLRSGWQADTPRTEARFGPLRLQRLGLDVPVARAADGRPITGRVRAEITAAVVGTNTLGISGGFADGHRTYAPVSMHSATDLLTVRSREGDRRRRIPRSQWRFADCMKVPFPGVPDGSKLCLRDGFDTDRIYELIYTAKDPLVLGIGLAATRDLVAFYRFADADAQGNPNPLRARLTHAVGFGVSQSGNYLKTLLHLGFNQDAAGSMVFDGLIPVVATRRTALNVRFGQPGRGAGQREDHLYPGHSAPATWLAADDPIGRRSVGLLDRCRAAGACPKVLHLISSSEYWQLQGSVTHVDATGRRDLPLPPEVRLYALAGVQHSPAQQPARGICVAPNNPAPMRETQRALLVALLQWVKDGVEPPASRYARVDAGQMVLASQLKWPAIPDSSYLALVNAMPLLDYGQRYIPVDESGIVSEEPPRNTGRRYTLLVPQVNADGNEVGGMHTTMTAVPLGTYTGWNHRAAGFGGGELCSLNGSYFPFSRTREERMATSDPRLSLQERYGDHAGYVDAVRNAANQLVAVRLLLPDDAARLVREADNGDTLR